MRVYFGLRSTDGFMNSASRTAPELRRDFTRITQAHIQMIKGLSADVAAKIKPSRRCVSVPQTLFTEAIRRLSPVSMAIPSGNSGIFGEKPVSTLRDLNYLLKDCLAKPGFASSAWIIESANFLHLYFEAANRHQRADVVGVSVPLDVHVSDRTSV